LWGSERNTWTQSAPTASASASGCSRPRWAPTAGSADPIPATIAASLDSPGMRKRLLILGSTGSIGEQAMEVVADSDDLELAGLSAGHSWERLCAQARKHRVGTVALSDSAAAEAAARS